MCVLGYVRVIINRERVSVNACDYLTKGVCMLVCVCEYECVLRVRACKKPLNTNHLFLCACIVCMCVTPHTGVCVCVVSNGRVKTILRHETGEKAATEFMFRCGSSTFPKMCLGSFDTSI